MPNWDDQDVNWDDSVFWDDFSGMSGAYLYEQVGALPVVSATSPLQPVATVTGTGQYKYVDLG